MVQYDRSLKKYCESYKKAGVVVLGVFGIVMFFISILSSKIVKNIMKIKDGRAVKTYRIMTFISGIILIIMALVTNYFINSFSTNVC
jgi:hypothetical protein